MIKQCHITPRSSGKTTQARKLARELNARYYDIFDVKSRTDLEDFVFRGRPFSDILIVDNIFYLGKNSHLFDELAYNNNFDFYIFGTPVRPWDFKNNHFHQRLLNEFPENFI